MPKVHMSHVTFVACVHRADASTSLAELAPLMRHPADFIKRFSAGA